MKLLYKYEFEGSAYHQDKSLKLEQADHSFFFTFHHEDESGYIGFSREELTKLRDAMTKALEN